MTIYITPPCMMCGKTTEVEVDSAALHRWQSQGWLIQVALPDLDDGERELIKSGIHPDCWDELFPPDDEDEDECPGHPDDDNSILAGQPMGETHYCDGSCQR